jgi:hypothetical protein
LACLVPDSDPDLVTQMNPDPKHYVSQYPRCYLFITDATQMYKSVHPRPIPLRPLSGADHKCDLFLLIILKQLAIALSSLSFPVPKNWPTRKRQIFVWKTWIFVSLSGLDDLVSCPFCPFQKIMQDPNDKAGTNNQ